MAKNDAIMSRICPTAYAAQEDEVELTEASRLALYCLNFRSAPRMLMIRNPFLTRMLPQQLKMGPIQPQQDPPGTNFAER